MLASRSFLPWLALAAAGALFLALSALRGGDEGGGTPLEPLDGQSPPATAGPEGLAHPAGPDVALDSPGEISGRAAGSRMAAGVGQAGRIGDPVGVLRGRVRHAETGLPAAGLCFWLEQPQLWGGAESAAHVETDVEGRFVTKAAFRRALVEVGLAEADCGSGDRRFELVPRRVQAVGEPLELYAHGPRLVLHVRAQTPEGDWVPRPQVSLVPVREARSPGFVHRIDASRVYFDRERQLVDDLALSGADRSVFPVFQGQLDEFGELALLRSHAGRELRFATGDGLSLVGLSGEVHHTFQLLPRPHLQVRLLDAAGEFDPTGVEAVARFASGDETLAEFTRGRRTWEFRSGWAVPGECDVRLVGAVSRRVLAERRVLLRGGEVHLVEFERAELPLLPGDGEPFIAVAGTVKDREGAPLADVQLEARWTGGRRVLFTGRSGEFQLAMRTRVGPITISIAEDVSAGRFSPMERSVPFGTRTLEFQRVSRDEVHLRLRVVDSGTQETVLGLRHVQLHRAGALPRVDVGLLDCDLDEPWMEGSYAPAAGARYVVRVPHYQAARGALPSTGVAGERDLVLSLTRGFRDELLVASAEDGAPLPGVRVQTFAGATLGITGADGRVALLAERWPEGLVFVAEGYAPERWRLDWEGLCAGVAGRIELSRSP